MAFTYAPGNVGRDLECRLARIPKGGGGYREVYIAAPDDKKRLRALLPELEGLLAKIDICGANYAFEKGKNCALNALQHIGYRYTLSMDLKDFFDSVTPQHVAGVLPDALIAQCFLNGSPKQGLPTSPLVATIAFLPCDKKIKELLSKLAIPAIYTRYADDLIFSFDDRKCAGKIRVVVSQTVERYGFEINAQKTKLQDSRNGRRIITGIAVDQKGIYPTRQTRRKLRAAAHQQNKANLLGLEEWSKCKLPLSM